MPSFNKIILMGNLTRDPQLSYTPSQTAVVDFGLATNRQWTAADGSQRDDTCFVDCRAFGRIAENINKFFTKGKPILIEGRLTFDSWTGQDGTKRSKHRVTVEGFTFMPNTGGGQEAAAAATEEAPTRAEPWTVSGPPAGAKTDDEIPF